MRRRPPLSAQVLRSLAAREVAHVTGNPLWNRQVSGGWKVASRVLSLPSRLNKWKGVWLLLGTADTLRTAVEKQKDDATEDLGLALNDAAWIWNHLDDPELPRLDNLSQWLRTNHVRDEFVRKWLENHQPQQPVSDRRRLEKSLSLLNAALQANAQGRRHLRWGVAAFSLQPTAKVVRRKEGTWRTLQGSQMLKQP